MNIRYRGSYAYIDGTADSDTMRLCRLRYLGSPDNWSFAIYLASKDGYEDSILPRGSFTGAPEEALDCACGLYLNDITAWTEAGPAGKPSSARTSDRNHLASIHRIEGLSDGVCKRA